MTWWCSAQGTPWTWAWQAYPGVWLLVGMVAGGYLTTLPRWDPTRDEAPRGTRGRLAAFFIGLLVVWAATDWPVGALGAGYLLSVHTAQYLLLALVAPPLLLYGTPPWMLRRLFGAGRAARAARFLTRPLLAFAIFNGVMLATHLPALVDGLTRTQLGSFSVDVAWLMSGVVFWWPVLAPLPEWRPLPPGGRIVYLIVNVFIPTVPASFLTFSDYPIYGLYELAPRVGLTATADQQLAGIVMKTGGGLIILGAASVIFFRWWARESADET